jgi:predicted RNA-binding protein YlxR (DUF448 family)
LQSRHVPMRKCVVCHKRFPKKQLLRVVRSEVHTAVYDDTGKMPGRGAYVCATPTCTMRAKKTKAFERVFHGVVDCTLYDHLYEKSQGGQPSS